MPQEQFVDSIDERMKLELGTPFCIMINFETIEDDNAVTIRDMNTTEQVRMYSYGRSHSFFAQGHRWVLV
jgi:glycyl-tRNA synthetase (class II)